MKPLIENFSDNVEIQVMEKKIQEIVEWISMHEKQDFQEPIVIWGEPLRKKKESLGCNTLPVPEEKCNYCKEQYKEGALHFCRRKWEDKASRAELEKGIEKQTLPEENPFHNDNCNERKKTYASHMVCDCLCHEPIHNHSRGEAGCGVCVKRQKECEHKEYGNGLSGMECVDCGFVRDTSKEKELFDMVYQWGKKGIRTDEKCNAFQDLLREIKL